MCLNESSLYITIPVLSKAMDRGFFFGFRWKANERIVIYCFVVRMLVSASVSVSV